MRDKNKHSSGSLAELIDLRIEKLWRGSWSTRSIKRNIFGCHESTEDAPSIHSYPVNVTKVSYASTGIMLEAMEPGDSEFLLPLGTINSTDTPPQISVEIRRTEISHYGMQVLHSCLGRTLNLLFNRSNWSIAFWSLIGKAPSPPPFPHRDRPHHSP